MGSARSRMMEHRGRVSGCAATESLFCCVCVLGPRRHFCFVCCVFLCMGCALSFAVVVVVWCEVGVWWFQTTGLIVLIVVVRCRRRVSLIHTFIHSYIHSFIHSFIHSLRLTAAVTCRYIIVGPPNNICRHRCMFDACTCAVPLARWLAVRSLSICRGE